MIPWWAWTLAVVLMVREVWRWRQWRRFIRETADLGFVDLQSGHKMAYRQEGTGPDILLVHGLGASMRCWHEVTTLLKDQYRVTCVDLLGFGRSVLPPSDVLSLDLQRSALEQVIRTLDLKSPVVVGCSMGGAIAFDLGRKGDVTLSGIVAMAPAINPCEIPPAPKAYPWIRLLGWAGAGPLSMMAIKRHVTGRWFWPLGESVRNSWTPYYNARAFAPLLDSLRWMRNQTGLESLAPLDLPILILHGQRDPIISVATSESVARLLPQAKVQLHKGRHHLMEEDPQWVANQIREFSESTVSLSKNRGFHSQYVEKSVRKS